MFAWVMWSTSFMTTNMGYLRSPLHLAGSSLNVPIIQRIVVSYGPHHKYSSVRPAWSINPRRLTHNLLLPMTPWLAPFFNVVDLPLWTQTPTANRIVWVTSILIKTSLWDTNFEERSILTIRKQTILWKQLSQNVKLSRCLISYYKITDELTSPMVLYENERWMNK